MEGEVREARKGPFVILSASALSGDHMGSNKGLNLPLMLTVELLTSRWELNGSKAV